MARKKTIKEVGALYYPFIEVRDSSWLFSAALFWDEISTITPDVEQPYKSAVSRFLADEGILVPYRAAPNRQEVMHISERISELLGTAAFRPVLGDEHWLLQQSRRFAVHPDKIGSNLQHELERLGWSAKRPDGYLEMDSGLAAAYILLLAVEVAGRLGCSLVTDQYGSHQAVEAARFQDAISVSDEFGFHRRREEVSRDFVDACVSEMVLTWFRIDPETDAKKIVKFRRRHRDELERMRAAVLQTNAGLLTDEELTYDGLRRKAKEYVHTQIKPAYDELKRTLRGEQIRFLPGALEAFLYGAVPGGAVAVAGHTWALVASPICGVAVKGVKHLANRRATLENSPWSYLYMSEKKLGLSS